MNTSSNDHDIAITHYIASMMSLCADIGALRGKVSTDVRIHCESKEIGGHGIILSSRYSFSLSSPCLLSSCFSFSL